MISPRLSEYVCESVAHGNRKLPSNIVGITFSEFKDTAEHFFGRSVHMNTNSALRYLVKLSMQENKMLWKEDSTGQKIIYVAFPDPLLYVVVFSEDARETPKKIKVYKKFDKSGKFYIGKGVMDIFSADDQSEFSEKMIDLMKKMGIL